MISDFRQSSARQMLAALITPENYLHDADITQHLYSPAGLLRFTIEPEGGVTEHVYRNRFKIATHSYANEIDINPMQRATFENIMIVPDATHDGKTVYINDKLGQPRFTVEFDNENTAYLVSKEFNTDGKVIKEIRYATALDPKKYDFEKLTLDEMVALANTLPQDKNRVTLSFYAKGALENAEPLLLFQLENGVLLKNDYNLQG